MVTEYQGHVIYYQKSMYKIAVDPNRQNVENMIIEECRAHNTAYNAADWMYIPAPAVISREIFQKEVAALGGNAGSGGSFSRVPPQYEAKEGQIYVKPYFSS